METMFERVGGSGFFEELVAEFYRRVAGDEVLAALYPEAPDFEGAQRRFALFLIQYWGGPAAYSMERGHPRLRMRHFPFSIGVDERDRWLTHMRAAVSDLTSRLDDGAAIAIELMAYFGPAADQMRNEGLALRHR